MRRSMFVLCTLMLTLIAAPAWAQAGRGPQAQRQQRSLAPEAQETAWSWQARGIAHDMQLDEATTDKLVVAYVDSRKTLGEKVKAEAQSARKARGKKEGGNPPEARERERSRAGAEATRAMADAARTELNASIGAFLSPEQTTKAMESLGAFGRQWDRMVHVAITMEPPVTEPYAALTAIANYNRTTHALRGKGDREQMRDDVKTAREQLKKELATVMTTEQLEQFDKATRLRRGPARRNRGEGGDGQGKRRGGSETL